MSAPLDWDRLLSRLHPDDVDAFEEASMRSYRSLEPWRCEFRVLTPDGERWISGHANPESAGGGAVVWHGVLQDVTGLGAQTEELAAEREENRLLSTIINAEGAVSITFADSKSRGFPLTFVNDSFLSLTGFERSEVIGRKCDFLQGEETDGEELKRIATAMGRGESVTACVLNYKKDGTAFWNRLDLSPVRDESGRLSGYVGLQNDVTEEVLRERSSREREKMQALGELAGGVAHEINNLLQPIRTMSEVCAEEVGDGDEEVAESLSAISRNAELAGGIVSDILSFARGAPNDEGDPAVCVRDACRDVAAFLRETVPASVCFDVSEIEGASPPFRVRVRKRELTKALSNLVRNAADATGEKGCIRIGVSFRQLGKREAKRAGLAPGRCAVVWVSDNGCGMDEKTLSSVFDPFFTTKPIGSGTGIGMPIVYRTARGWGGGVLVDSAPGEGTLVRVLAPEEGSAGHGG